MKLRLWLLAAAVGMLCGCNGIHDPYITARDRGTPADRTGGARNAPWIHGGGPGQNFSPGPGHNNKSPD